MSDPYRIFPMAERLGIEVDEYSEEGNPLIDMTVMFEKIMDRIEAIERNIGGRN